MPYNLWDIGGSFAASPNRDVDAQAHILRSAIHQHGLSVQIEHEGGFTVSPDLELQLGPIAGAESEGNLRVLATWINQIMEASRSLTRAQFRDSIRPYVQDGNRSVESALRNLNAGSVASMLDFMLAFIGKDIKLPLRLLNLAQDNTDYGFDPEMSYSEVETGTFHTLQVLGENQSIRTYGVYLEDAPVVRRYLRYIDSLAKPFGMRLVYCPKEFNHLEEISTPVRPTWTRENGQVVRQIHSDRYKLLYVVFTFDYSMFRNSTVVETEVQPGQTPRRGIDMDYTPILVDNLHSIVAVLRNLGSFASCKLYYKDYLNSVRSSQAAQSS